MKVNTHKSLYQLVNIYANSSILDDDDNIFIIKTIINELPKLQKDIFLTYIDTGSLRQTAEIMNCSATTIMNNVKSIKKIIIEKYNKQYNNAL